MIGSSPRTWGCFPQAPRRHQSAAVFPTHVGVFLVLNPASVFGGSLPHARGGVSQPRSDCGCFRPSSPRTWGCFCRRVATGCARSVFPTHVGVFLKVSASRWTGPGLPHARGGVSGDPHQSTPANLSSPRTWGCFQNTDRAGRPRYVFPTHVGVFPHLITRKANITGLPHARGGVSVVTHVGKSNVLSSPRTWGCFLLSLRRQIQT